MFGTALFQAEILKCFEHTSRKRNYQDRSKEYNEMRLRNRQNFAIVT
jgi:hypothetical protein